MNPSTAPDALADSRRRDSDARKTRVRTTLAQMRRNGENVTVAAVARRGRVGAKFPYRHTDAPGSVVRSRTLRRARLHRAGVTPRNNLIEVFWKERTRGRQVARGRRPERIVLLLHIHVR